MWTSPYAQTIIPFFSFLKIKLKKKRYFFFTWKCIHTYVCGYHLKREKFLLFFSFISWKSLYKFTSCVKMLMKKIPLWISEKYCTFFVFVLFCRTTINDDTISFHISQQREVREKLLFFFKFLKKNKRISENSSLEG